MCSSDLTTPQLDLFEDHHECMNLKPHGRFPGSGNLVFTSPRMQCPHLHPSPTPHRRGSIILSHLQTQKVFMYKLLLKCTNTNRELIFYILAFSTNTLCARLETVAVDSVGAETGGGKQRRCREEAGDVEARPKM